MPLPLAQGTEPPLSVLSRILPRKCLGNFTFFGLVCKGSLMRAINSKIHPAWFSSKKRSTVLTFQTFPFRRCSGLGTFTNQPKKARSAIVFFFGEGVWNWLQKPFWVGKYYRNNPYKTSLWFNAGDLTVRWDIVGHLQESKTPALENSQQSLKKGVPGLEAPGFKKGLKKKGLKMTIFQVFFGLLAPFRLALTFFGGYVNAGSERPRQLLFRVFAAFSREKAFDPCRWPTISQAARFGESLWCSYPPLCGCYIKFLERQWGSQFSNVKLGGQWPLQLCDLGVGQAMCQASKVCVGRL